MCNTLVKSFIGSLPSYLPLAPAHGAQGGRPARPSLGAECESGRSVTSTTTNPYSTSPHPPHTAAPLQPTPTHLQFSSTSAMSGCGCRSILTVRRELCRTAPLPCPSPNYLTKYNSDSVNICSEILASLKVP